MEYAQWVLSKGAESAFAEVLILVLMEYAQWVKEVLSEVREAALS